MISKPQFATILFLQLFLFVIVESDHSTIVHNRFQTNATANASLELDDTIPDPLPNQQQVGCWNQPAICNPKGEFPPKVQCCNNRCVNVTYDSNNCGVCRLACPFSWQCCGGLCTNTFINPANCGTCGNRCPLGTVCFYGLCAQSPPPSPSSPPTPLIPVLPPPPPQQRTPPIMPRPQPPSPRRVPRPQPPRPRAAPRPQPPSPWWRPQPPSPWWAPGPPLPANGPEAGAQPPIME
ncbi:hypothetical protein UlMin_003688 [Ulmus minor]